MLPFMKIHPGFLAARWFVTAIYMVCLGCAIGWTIDGRGLAFPIAALLLTTSYMLLMFLLWLYERYPPPPIA